MNGYLAGIVAILTSVAVAVAGELISEEVRDRLDQAPRAILRLAARWLDPGQRITVYHDEWEPELTYILKGTEARPVTRLIAGTWYALGILANTRRIARHLHRPAPGMKYESTRTSLRPALPLVGVALGVVVPGALGVVALVSIALGASAVFGVVVIVVGALGLLLPALLLLALVASGVSVLLRGSRGLLGGADLAGVDRHDHAQDVALVGADPGQVDLPAGEGPG